MKQITLLGTIRTSDRFIIIIIIIIIIVIIINSTGWTIGVLVFESRQGLGIFFFTTVSTSALGPTQPPVQWVSAVLSLGVKRPGREADH
jgi:hypothetical protein